MKHTIFKGTGAFLAILGLVLSGCTASEPIYFTPTVNMTGETGAQGIPGNFTSGQNITAGSLNVTGNLTLTQNGTGANTVTLGTLNSPGGAVLGTPYTWIKVIAGDGTVVYMPAWK